jgi:outer membrane protein assembly factor BamB
VATDNGAVFFVRYDAAGGSELVALTEASGTELWHASFGNIDRVNAPAVGNGQVYVTSSGSANTFLWVFDQRTGTLLSKTGLTEQLKTYFAPTVVGADVYAAEDGYTTRFSGVTGALTWRAAVTGANPGGPAVDASYAYAYSGARLNAVDVATGTDRWTVDDPLSSPWAGDAVPVVLSDSQAFVSNSGHHLIAFDIVHHTVAWTVPRTNLNPVMSPPAFGNGTLYKLGEHGDALEARSPVDGALQWTSSLGNWNFDRLVVTRNLAFVSSYTRTTAIDLATHKTVWSYPMGGDLSISANGVLYILCENGRGLVAINLQ